MITIAIQSDDVRQPNGKQQSFSQRWRELAGERGITVREVDVYRHDCIQQLTGCDGFMWRYGFDALSLRSAKPILAAVEHGAAIPVYPSWRTNWHFEDKISQRYLLEAAGIPVPETWVFWNKQEAIDFSRQATYPIVVKFTSGIRSKSVRLLHNAAEAEHFAQQMFGPGRTSVNEPRGRVDRLLGKHKLAVDLLRTGKLPNLQHGYLYLQEFLANNAYDTRVTVIGNRAFAFRRFNRDGDFRASGSGKISWDPAAIDLGIVRMAFRVAEKLGSQSLAIDGMYRGNEIVVGEISYAYAAWAIAECPGHWIRDSLSEGGLRWVEGQLRAEDAIFHDFIAEIEAKAPLAEVPGVSTLVS
jgi:hypothetical protein